MSNDNLASHIAHLGMSDPAEDDQATALADLQHEKEELPEGGTFDQPDQLLDQTNAGEGQETQPKDT